MGWLRALTSARWFPYVLIGSVAIAGAVFGWGYMKGYNKAEATYLQEMNRALEAQMKRILKQKRRELHLAVEAEAKKHEISRRVQEVKSPTVSCDLPAPCLQWYDDILRAAAPNRPESD